jgi:hypothetical protein
MGRPGIRCTVDVRREGSDAKVEAADARKADGWEWDAGGRAASALLVGQRADCWQATHPAANGRNSNRSGAMATPQCTHTP